MRKKKKRGRRKRMMEQKRDGRIQGRR